MISYKDYYTKDRNTTDNEQRIDKRGTNSSAYRNFSYLACDMRDIVLP